MHIDTNMHAHAKLALHKQRENGGKVGCASCWKEQSLAALWIQSRLRGKDY